MRFDKSQLFLITGASSGIGRATALRLNDLGASAICVARNTEKLAELKAAAPHPDNLILESRDLSQELDDIPAFVTGLRKAHGKFQGLAFCAGTGEVLPGRQLNEAIIRKNLDINLISPLLFAKAFADKRNVAENGASCVFVASVAALKSDKGQAIYAASKAGLIAGIKAFAREAAANKTRMNCVSPSAVKTPLLESNQKQVLEEQGKLYPFGFGEPEDIASLIVFLLSNESRWITAQNYVADCGAVL